MRHRLRTAPGLVALVAASLLPGTALAADGPDPATLTDQELVRVLTSGGDTLQKCGTPYVLELQSRGLDLATMAPAETAETLTYLTPEGHFTIDYDTTGTAAVDPTDDDLSGVPDYVERIGSALERSWTVDTDSLGFPAPDIGADRYHVKLVLTGNFGETVPNAAMPGGSYIQIRFSMAPFCGGEADPETCEANALLATVAHEFKHAVQVANGWPLLDLPRWWIELDASWIEDIVFDDSNDYYRFITNSNSPFMSPDASLAEVASYEDCTWGHFLSERHGSQIMVDFADDVAAQVYPYTPQSAYRQAVENSGDVWNTAWGDYTVATYLTGTRATGSVGFEEAAHYPTSTVAVLPSLPWSSSTPWVLRFLAMRFHQFQDASRDTPGKVRVVFEGDTVGEWTVRVVFQNESETVVLPVPLNSGAGTLITDQRLENYDRVGVLVGNARIPLPNVLNASYNLTLEMRSVPSKTRSMSGLKSRFRGSPGG
jgi:hypothetical protein